MATVTLNAYSIGFPTITNNIRAAVYKVSDPTALIASIIDTTIGHPSRIWSFTGLDRTNYLFSLDNIDGSGNVVQNLAAFNVVPANIDGLLSRQEEQIEVGVTPNLFSWATSATFDGSSSSPDYRGWNINICAVGNQNFLIRGVDYSWNQTTGVFTLLNSGDVFASGQWYNVIFDNNTEIAGGSMPTTFDLPIQLITANKTLVATDFGQQLIVEPSGTSLTITLPDISTVVSGRALYIDSSSTGTQYCVSILPNGSDTINFLDGNLFVCPEESLIIYKFTRSAGVYEWRVRSADGNFRHVGELVSDDNNAVYNKLILGGESVDKTIYARLYNYVLSLPSSQVVNYDDWATGNNFTKFSFANSANPTYANQFKIPSRVNLFERMVASGRVVGDYQSDAIISHKHESSYGNSNHIFGSGVSRLVQQLYGTTASKITELTSDVSNATTDIETRPKNYCTNKYILV